MTHFLSIQFCFLVFSHIFLVPSIIWTWNRRRQLWIEMSILTLIFVWSIGYHACYESDWCVFHKLGHSRLDHYFAQLTIPLIFFYLGCVDKIYIKGILYIIATQIDFVFTAFYGSNYVPKIAMIVYCTLAVAIYSIAQKYYRGKRIFRHFDWIDGAVGLTIGIMSLVFFVMVDGSNEFYYYVHSMWHFFSFWAGYFLLETRNPERTLLISNSVWKQWYRYLYGPSRHKKIKHSEI